MFHLDKLYTVEAHWNVCGKAAVYVKEENMSCSGTAGRKEMYELLSGVESQMSFCLTDTEETLTRASKSVHHFTHYVRAACLCRAAVYKQRARFDNVKIVM